MQFEDLMDGLDHLLNGSRQAIRIVHNTQADTVCIYCISERNAVPSAALMMQTKKIGPG